MKKPIIIALIAIAAAGAIAAGSIFAKRYLFAPKVIGRLDVLSYAPQGADVPISTDGITVMFNKAVVPLATLDSGRDKSIPIKVTPSIGGKFFWLGTHGFILRPGEPLAPATTYRVEMPPGVVSVDGYRLDQPLSWEFSTVAPRLITMAPGDGETLLPHDAQLFFRFNIAMDASDVEGKIHTLDAASGEPLSIPRTFTWGDDGHTLSLKFTGELPWASGVKIVFPRGLRAKRGEIGTAADVILSYKTPEKQMKLERVVGREVRDYRAEGDNDEDRAPKEVELRPGKAAVLPAGSGICFLFSQPIKKKSFEKAFSVAAAKDDKPKGAAQPAAQEEASKKKPQPYFYFSDYEGFPSIDAKGEQHDIEGFRQGCVAMLEDAARAYSFSIDPKKIESLSGAPHDGGAGA